MFKNIYSVRGRNMWDSGWRVEYNTKWVVLYAVAAFVIAVRFDVSVATADVS